MHLSYHLSHPDGMAQRQKRSISPPSLPTRDQSATAKGTSVSAWIANTASHRLRIEAGRHGVAEWEREHGVLATTELSERLGRARAALRRERSPNSA